MPLSPKPRRHLHTRTIQLEGYFRDDGLFDIEAHIVDRKTYSYESRWRGTVAAGYPVHDMWLRLSVDGDLVVREVDAAMDVQPYTMCSDILDNFQRLIGLRIGGAGTARSVSWWAESRAVPTSPSCSARSLPSPFRPSPETTRAS